MASSINASLGLPLAVASFQAELDAIAIDLWEVERSTNYDYDTVLPRIKIILDKLTLQLKENTPYWEERARLLCYQAHYTILLSQQKQKTRGILPTESMRPVTTITPQPNSPAASPTQQTHENTQLLSIPPSTPSSIRLVEPVIAMSPVPTAPALSSSSSSSTTAPNCSFQVPFKGTTIPSHLELRSGDGQVLSVHITTTRDMHDALSRPVTVYNLTETVSGKHLGRMSTERRENEQHSYLKIISLSNETEKEKDPKKQVHGVGKALIACAVAESFQSKSSEPGLPNRPGYLSVEATGGHFFYWKMGFRPTLNLENQEPLFAWSGPDSQEQLDRVRSDLGERTGKDPSSIKYITPAEESYFSGRLAKYLVRREHLAIQRGVLKENIPLEDLFILPIREYIEIRLRHANKSERLALDNVSIPMSLQVNHL